MDVSRRVSDKRLGDQQPPWGNEKAPASGMGAIQHLERSEREASLPGQNASREHESGNNQARKQEQRALRSAKLGHGKPQHR